MAKALKLKFFKNTQAIVDYAVSELQDTLRDDYDRMASKEERQHYTNEDRREMSRRIYDVKSVETLLRHAPSMLIALQSISVNIELHKKTGMTESGYLVNAAKAAESVIANVKGV